jgi:hypothetical protein
VGRQKRLDCLFTDPHKTETILEEQDSFMLPCLQQVLKANSVLFTSVENSVCNFNIVFTKQRQQYMTCPSVQAFQSKLADTHTYMNI